MLTHLCALRFLYKNNFAFRSFHKSKIDVLNDDFSIAFIRNGLQERMIEKQMKRNIENDDDCGRTFAALDDYDIFDAETKLILQESMSISHKKKYLIKVNHGQHKHFSFLHFSNNNNTRAGRYSKFTCSSSPKQGNSRYFH